MCRCYATHHNKPCDEGCIPDIPETVVIDVHLHLQVEEEALIDDVGHPAKTSEVSDFNHVSLNEAANLKMYIF